ncbi:MAG: hypothetical protein LAO19_19360 [Acidobacteriia bacterium]|nr:hypothetical protein [Terriglobia bacterium]
MNTCEKAQRLMPLVTGGWGAGRGIRAGEPFERFQIERGSMASPEKKPIAGSTGKFVFQWKLLGTTVVEAATKNEALRLFQESHRPEITLAGSHTNLRLTILIHGKKQQEKQQEKQEEKPSAKRRSENVFEEYS